MSERTERIDFVNQLRKVGLPELRYIIGRQVICEGAFGCLMTTIQSVSNVNDDGSIDLGVAPVNFNGDLVTHVVFLNKEPWANATGY